MLLLGRDETGNSACRIPLGLYCARTTGNGLALASIAPLIWKATSFSETGLYVSTVLSVMRSSPGSLTKRFVEGEDRRQATLLPDSLEDYVTEDNPVRVVDVFIDKLDLEALGFSGVMPEMTGRPAYHPATLLKIYLYDYLNHIQSSRRLERETQRNIELMWLTGRLMPDFNTIAHFRGDNGPAIRAACARFIVLCRQFTFSRGLSLRSTGASSRRSKIATRTSQGPWS